MLYQFQFRNVSDALKEDLKNYALSHLGKLEKYLKKFPEDDTLLIITIHHQEKHTYFDVRCALHIGKTTIYHREKSHNPKEALDNSEINLKLRVKKHIEELRGKKKKAMDR